MTCLRMSTSCNLCTCTCVYIHACAIEQSCAYIHIYMCMCIFMYVNVCEYVLCNCLPNPFTCWSRRDISSSVFLVYFLQKERSWRAGNHHKVLLTCQQGNVGGISRQGPGDGGTFHQGLSTTSDVVCFCLHFSALQVLTQLSAHSSQAVQPQPHCCPV